MGTAYAIGYSYDAAGNRTSKTANGAVENYTYDAADNLLEAGLRSYSIDLAGNVQYVDDGESGEKSIMLYSDPYNRLSYILPLTDPDYVDTSFSYNGLGQRIQKAGTADIPKTIFRDDAIDSPVVADTFATYVWGPNGIVSELRGGTVNYYHGDALGTTRAMTTQGRTQTDTRETDAFGNLWGPGSNLATPTPFGYAGAWGYQTDADSGLMLLGHRYYDPSIGRFISRDPIQAGYNWYVYCDNDPVNGVDPEGLEDKRRKDPTGRSSGQFVNQTSKTVEVVIDRDNPDTLDLPANKKKDHIVILLVPPGYETVPTEIDVDYVRLGPDKWVHLASSRWGSTTLWETPIPNWSVGIGPHDPRRVGNDPNDSRIPNNMGPNPFRTVLPMGPVSGVQRGWIRPIHY